MQNSFNQSEYEMVKTVFGFKKFNLKNVEKLCILID